MRKYPIGIQDFKELHNGGYLYIDKTKEVYELVYGSPFLNQGKEVIALGVSFSSEIKEVAEWRSLPYETLLVEG